MTSPEAGAPAPPRWRPWLWAALALATIAGLAALSTYLTVPRTGGRMDPTSTGSDGAHALVALLRSHGTEVVVAGDVADVEREARRDALLLVAETPRLADDGLLARLAKAPGDLLLVEPNGRAREALTPAVHTRGIAVLRYQPDCALRAANRAGPVEWYTAATYTADTDPPAVSCYGGALVRYRDSGRTVTVVGGAFFMMNKGLLSEGNAALAMNLAGAHPRLVWYAPQHLQGEPSGGASIFDLMPDNVNWMLWQLGLVVVLLAVWQGRRIGPLVAEELPVVVRASETVEGRGRLYRSRRARDRAAQALRSATLQQLLPQLGLGVNTPPPAVVMAVAQRSGTDPAALQRQLFGPAPDSDAGLLQLAHALDDIERQVSHP